MPRQPSRPHERSIRLDAEGQVSYQARLSHPDKDYPSGLLIQILEEGAMIGILVPKPSTAGDDLVRELHAGLNNEVPKSWTNFVTAKQQEWASKNKHQ